MYTCKCFVLLCLYFVVGLHDFAHSPAVSAMDDLALNPLSISRTDCSSMSLLIISVCDATSLEQLFETMNVPFLF